MTSSAASAKGGLRSLIQPHCHLWLQTSPLPTVAFKPTQLCNSIIYRRCPRRPSAPRTPRKPWHQALRRADGAAPCSAPTRGGSRVQLGGSVMPCAGRGCLARPCGITPSPSLHTHHSPGETAFGSTLFSPFRPAPHPSKQKAKPKATPGCCGGRAPGSLHCRAAALLPLPAETPE